MSKNYIIKDKFLSAYDKNLNKICLTTQGQLCFFNKKETGLLIKWLKKRYGKMKDDNE